MPALSVILATYNRRQILGRTLDALCHQSCQDFRVVVVDDGSSDGTWEWLTQRAAAAGPPEIHALRQENRGQGAARNHALRSVHDGLVLFLGDDILLRPTAVAEHLAAHGRLAGRGGPAAVVGFTDWCRGEMKVTPLLEMINTEGHQFGYGHMTPGEEVPFTCFYTSNVSLPRDVLGDEPFDPAFTAYGWEDVELAYRLHRQGLRLFYEPSAAAEHLHPMDLRAVFARQRLVGRGLATLLELHPELEDSPLLSPSSPPRWFPLAKRCVPALVPLLSALDSRQVPLSKRLLHRVLMCAYYLGREE